MDRIDLYMWLIDEVTDFYRHITRTRAPFTSPETAHWVAFFQTLCDEWEKK